MKAIAEGYWAHILAAAAEPSSSMFSGRLGDGPTLCSCPGCGGTMFPVFTIARDLSVLPKNDNFYANGMLTLDVCPQCSHALSNYAVRYTQGVRQVVGGYVDSGGPINNVDQPYQSRAVRLNRIDPAFWLDEGQVDAYHDRQLFDGVNHQFGGRQLKENRRHCDACLVCGEPIEFFGCVDSDDLNVPLYENNRPLALEFGDRRSMNLFACEQCSSVNYCMSV